MEDNGVGGTAFGGNVQPDLLVDNSPADMLGGRDRQLEVAVEELMKELQGPKRNVASKEE